MADDIDELLPKMRRLGDREAKLQEEDRRKIGAAPSAASNYLGADDQFESPRRTTIDRRLQMEAQLEEGIETEIDISPFIDAVESDDMGRFQELWREYGGRYGLLFSVNFAQNMLGILFGDENVRVYETGGVTVRMHTTQAVVDRYREYLRQNTTEDGSSDRSDPMADIRSLFERHHPEYSDLGGGLYVLTQVREVDVDESPESEGQDDLRLSTDQLAYIERIMSSPEYLARRDRFLDEYNGMLQDRTESE
tara:strand:- start:103 stop:855 length:753 start_codon:yes stop_codon:yes gene_type:complete